MGQEGEVAGECRLFFLWRRVCGQGSSSLRSISSLLIERPPSRLSHVAGGLDSFSKLYNRCPGDQADLKQAFTTVPTERSPIAKTAGNCLFGLCESWTLAARSWRAPEAIPGEMFYAVSPDQQDAWFSATDRKLGRFIDFFSVEGDPRVRHRRVNRP